MNTEAYVGQLATVLKARLKWLDQVKYLGRQDPTGIVLAPEEYIGLDDQSGNFAYVRYAGERDHTFARPERRLTSAPETMVTANLRMVVVHNCENEDAIEWATINWMMMAPFAVSNKEYSIVLVNSTKDQQRIFTEETKGERGPKEHKRDDRWRLLMIDFRLTYHMNATVDESCFPNCITC